MHLGKTKETFFFLRGGCPEWNKLRLLKKLNVNGWKPKSVSSFNIRTGSKVTDSS